MRRFAMVLGVFVLTACGGGNGGVSDVTDVPSSKSEGFAESEGVGGGEVCDPQCGNKECGPSECPGIECGVCTFGDCNDKGECICVPDCTEKNKECGDDGCGGSCATCDPEFECVDFKCIPCEPLCAGLECGEGGCGDPIECGTCEDPALPVCSKEGICIEACDLPDAWDGVGKVSLLHSPADVAVVETVCPDFSGDSKGDNGLKALASMINPELQKAIDEGTFGILFEFQGVTDFADTADFILAGLMGEPDLGSVTDYLVDPAAYDEKCQAIIQFPGGNITGGTLAAGPSQFILDLKSFGIDEVPLVLTIGNTQLSGDVDVGSGAGGVTVTNGILAGVLTKELVDEALAEAEKFCDVPDPEPFCSYLSVIKQFLPLLFDLDMEPKGAPDGVKDAASVCFQYELAPAVITGYMPE